MKAYFLSRSYNLGHSYQDLEMSVDDLFVLFASWNMKVLIDL